MTTLKNHFRDDFSSYHVVNYDTLTGEVINKQTHQGIAANSAWARGQAWALYGFTMTFRETGDSIFLKQAEQVAQFILEHKNLPDDGVPYWDFDDPNIPNAPRDASAAAIICSGLYELNLYQTNQPSGYKVFADKLFDSLSSPAYFAGKKASHNFLLNHSTGNFPKNDEIDVPIIYADYYFLEALLRKIKTDGYKPGVNTSVVLKLDDLKSDAAGVHPRWQKVYTYALNNQVPIAIGVVANTIENEGEVFLSWLANAANEPMVELWNHGYDHKKVVIGDKKASEFKGTALEFQQWHLKRAQELMDSVTGKFPVTFGAPYNHIDSVTLQVLNSIPEIKVWLYADSVDFPNAKQLLLKRIDPLNIEYPVHNPSFYQLWNNLYFYRNEFCIVIQGHPMSWDDENFKQFAQMVTYLNQTGFKLTLPSNISK
jgi:peptidoglycan/xylan/chitin deacetylase (PgdA/CDA1 family)